MMNVRQNPLNFLDKVNLNFILGYNNIKLEVHLCEVII